MGAHNIGAHVASVQGISLLQECMKQISYVRKKASPVSMIAQR